VHPTLFSPKFCSLKIEKRYLSNINLPKPIIIYTWNSAHKNIHWNKNEINTTKGIKFIVKSICYPVRQRAKAHNTDIPKKKFITGYGKCHKAQDKHCLLSDIKAMQYGQSHQIKSYEKINCGSYNDVGMVCA
jgi:hypothetical protein